MSKNGTGIIYPTIELGGVTYELKLTRDRIRFRMSDAGCNISDLRVVGVRSFAVIVRFLHCLISPTFAGTIEDLAEVIGGEEKLQEASLFLAEAIKKAFPPTLQAAPPAEAPKYQPPTPQ
jgi:hypothetical protein